MLLTGCAGLAPVADRPESFAFQDTVTTQIGRTVQSKLARHPGLSGFYLLTDGHDAFAARWILASHAERSIDAQYYLLHDDRLGHLFIDMLLQAADRGVRVRLLVDDMSLNGKKDIDAAALDTHPGVEIRVFNPFHRGVGRWIQFLSRYGEVTRRMHNKSFTIDNQITVIGGRNIGNEYFEADPDLIFTDLDVLAIGPVVDQVSATFDLYWNAPLSYPIRSLVKKKSGLEQLAKTRQALAKILAQHKNIEYLKTLGQGNLAVAISNRSIKYDWGKAKVVFDDPAKITADRKRVDLNLSTQLKPYTDSIAKELTIFSPYFVPGKKGLENLRGLRHRGVRIRVLTNSLASTDVPLVHAGYARYRKDLLRAGIELYEIDKKLTRWQRRQKKGLSGSSKSSLHAKSFVIDRERVFIGSMNMDPRSIVENTELGMMIESPEIAIRLNQWFDTYVADSAFRLALGTNDKGHEIVVWRRELEGAARIYTTEPNTGFWRRLWVGFMRLFVIESQL